jgi:hypothetical protein
MRSEMLAAVYFLPTTWINDVENLRVCIMLRRHASCCMAKLLLNIMRGRSTMRFLALK